MTLTTDTILLKMIELCSLQVQIDEIKAELEPFLIEGETFACELGKLTKVRGYDTISANAAGKPEWERFKENMLNRGMATRTTVKPSLRLTLNKATVA